jgi:hypothetical protein
MDDAPNGREDHDALRHLPALPDRACEEPRRGPPRLRASGPACIRDVIIGPCHHPALASPAPAGQARSRRFCAIFAIMLSTRRPHRSADLRAPACYRMGGVLAGGSLRCIVDWVVACLRRQRMHAQRPEGPALSGQRPPLPARAISAQVKLANPVYPVRRADRGPAPITRLSHLRHLLALPDRPRVRHCPPLLGQSGPARRQSSSSRLGGGAPRRSAQGPQRAARLRSVPIHTERPPPVPDTGPPCRAARQLTARTHFPAHADAQRERRRLACHGPPNRPGRAPGERRAPRHHGYSRALPATVTTCFASGAPARKTHSHGT